MRPPEFLESYVNERALVLSADHALEGTSLEDAAAVAARARVALRVGGVHAVHLGALEDDLGADFAAAQGRRRVGGKERIPGARGEDHDLAFLEVTDRLAADVRFDDLLDVERR